MKTVLLALGIGLLMASGGWAQEFVVFQDAEEIPVQPVPERITVDPDPAVSGIVAKIFDETQPWQLVNPAAPMSAGNGRTNGTVSADAEQPGKPRGFILFALDW
jgi:hypothetical protein